MHAWFMRIPSTERDIFKKAAAHFTKW
ncbi:hypothetical protein XaFJ1_GM001086 [Xanthomonas albilineans]|nr:hypothetical protein XaFJ1_GM001086 [Xanthomonas albilineans]